MGTGYGVEGEDVEEEDSKKINQHMDVGHRQQDEAQQGGVAHNNPQHNNKWFANTNMCYSCGWDVPYWHTSKTCPTGCRNAHHQEGCDRGNAQAYINAGHNVRLKGKEKTVYPINPHEGRR